MICQFVVKALSGLRSAIGFDGNGAQRRLVSEKLDFGVAFVPFGDERARRDSDSADVVVAKKIGFTEVVISAATESGNSLPSQHRYPIVDRLKAGFAGSVHEVGQAKRSALVAPGWEFVLHFYYRPEFG